MLCHLWVDFPSGGVLSIFPTKNLRFASPVLELLASAKSSPATATAQVYFCTVPHVVRVCKNCVRWQLLTITRQVSLSSGAETAEHMWQRCAYDVMLQNALGLRAGHLAGNDVRFHGERATKVVVCGFANKSDQAPFRRNVESRCS
jgi:hypothetical protein